MTVYVPIWVLVAASFAAGAVTAVVVLLVAACRCGRHDRCRAGASPPAPADCADSGDDGRALQF